MSTLWFIPFAFVWAFFVSWVVEGINWKTPTRYGLVFFLMSAITIVGSIWISGWSIWA